MRVASLGLGLALFWSLIPAWVLAGEMDGRLVLYLQRGEGGAPGVVLQLERFELLGSGAPIEIPLRESTWSSDESMSSITRIGDYEVPEGSYSGLRPLFRSVTAPAGVAPVHPAVPDSLILPAEMEIVAGQTSLWVIHWNPQAIEDPQLPYNPGLAAIEPSPPPPGGAILVSNEQSGTVTFLDRWGLDPRGEITVGAGPKGMIWSRLRQRLYVALSGEDAVAVLDLVTHRKEQQTTLHAGDEPSRLWLDEESSRLFVLNEKSSTVSILDAGFLQEIDRLVVEPEPVAFAYDRRLNRLYLSSRVRDAVVVYEMDGQREPRNWSVDGGAGELLLDTDRNRLFVASVRQRKILVLDLSSGAVLDRLELCSSAKGLALAPLGSEIVASASRCRRVSFVTVSQAMETGGVRLPFTPTLLTVDSASSRILVVMPDGSGLAVVQTQSRKLTGWIPVGERPYAVLVP